MSNREMCISLINGMDNLKFAKMPLANWKRELTRLHNFFPSPNGGYIESGDKTPLSECVPESVVIW